MKSHKTQQARKPYRVPHLIKYGELLRITAGTTKGGIARDGGAGGPKSKLTGSIQ